MRVSLLLGDEEIHLLDRDSGDVSANENRLRCRTNKAREISRQMNV